MLKARKLIVLLLAVSLAVTLFAGCGSKEESKPKEEAAKTETSKEETEKPKEKAKVSFCLSQTGWGGEAVDPELMAEVEKVIEEKTNTDLEIIAPPQSSYNEKLNVMLSSGQIPDIFAVRKATNNMQVYAARGYTMPLDDLLKNTPEITSQVGKYMEYVTVDGKVHGVPMYVPMSKNLWLRKDVMDKYGVNLSETPTTEEFYTEMKKLVDKGIVPFTFPKFLDNLPFFTNSFGAYFGIGKDSSGKYVDGFNTPEMKEALAYINKLYKEKIWDKEFLTNENTKIREMLYSGKAASTIDYFNRYIYYIGESAKVKAPTEFVPIYELKGPKGQGGNHNEAINDVLAISSKSKVPDRALDVIKYYVYSEEGVKLRILGVKDKHYTIENGEIKATEKATNSGYKCNVNQFFLYFPKIKDYGFKWDANTEKLLPKQVEVNEEVNKHLGPKYLVPGGKSTLYDKNQPAYKKKTEEIASKIIMGSTTVEKGFAEYEAFWKSISGDEMLKQLNQ